MKYFIINISILLFISILLCDAHIIVYRTWKHTASIEYDLFIDKSYHYKQTVLYYIYDLTRILRDIIWTFCFAKIAILVSYRLFKVLVVFFFYFITQFLFYIWDRNTIVLPNIIVYLYTAIALTYIFIPERKGGKLINLEDH